MTLLSRYYRNYGLEEHVEVIWNLPLYNKQNKSTFTPLALGSRFSAAMHLIAMSTGNWPLHLKVILTNLRNGTKEQLICLGGRDKYLNFRHLCYSPICTGAF